MFATFVLALYPCYVCIETTPACGTYSNVTTQTEATMPPNRNRTKLGVGERTAITMVPAPQCTVTWSVSGGGSVSPTTGISTTFTAHDRTSNPTITATMEGNWKSITYTVVEPTSETATKDFETTYPAGMQGVGMTLTTLVHPTDVSFKNVEFREVSGPASAIHGYFTDFNPAALAHQANPAWTPWNINNESEDNLEMAGLDPPFRFGGFQWDIPVRWRVIGMPTDAPLPNRLQTFEIANAAGTSTITKLGQSATRTP